MSRIYVVTTRASGVERYVRANTLNGAVRAVANEDFTAATASTEQLFQAFKAGFTILDSIEPEQLDLGGGK